jgi:alcohol dehydrogenase class IV
MRSAWSFHSAGQLVFGRGAIEDLGRHMMRRGWKSACIVTDLRLEEVGLVDRVTGPMQAASVRCSVFTGGEPEPSIAAAEAAIDYARNANSDCIVGLGGGSNMDLAKIVAAVVAHGGSPDSYFGFDRIPGPVTSLVCVPTTAGTGSEVSHAAVLTDTRNHMKVSTLSQHLRPTLALVDPALTDGCPRQITADSGIDALTHAIEAYTATNFDKLEEPGGGACAYEGRYPLGECIAEKSIRLVGEHLVAAVENGANQPARDGMALAATLAGLAFSNCGVALVHALEYPLGGALHCSHGAGNGLLLPHVMRFLLPVRAEAFAQVAALLGENVAGLSAHQAAEQAVVAVDRIRERIGVPGRIRDLGGRREQLPEFAAKSFAIKRLLATTPRAATESDLLQILEAAF